MKSRRRASETRSLIFRTCNAILWRDGLQTLTLDAVAKEAGLSKGGLLYHFPTKVALIEALFTSHLDRFDAAVQALYEADDDAACGRWLRAYAKASVDQIIDPETARLFAGLFAAGERYPSVLEIMRDRYEVWQRQIDQDGLAPERAALIRMIVDGLWFTQLYRYSPPSEELRGKVFELLFELSRAGNGEIAHG